MPIKPPRNEGIQALAEYLGISKATVSKALNGYTQVSEATRQRVLEAAVQFGYPVSDTERTRPSLLRKRIGWIYHSADPKTISSDRMDICSGFQQTTQQPQCMQMELLMLPLTHYTNDLQALSRMIQEYSLDGAFISNIRVNDPFFLASQSVSIPLVFWGAPVLAAMPNVASVTYDSIVGIGKAMTHLLTLGHRRIGFLNGDSEAFVSSERRDSYILSLIRAGLPCDEALIWTGDYSAACGAPALEHFLQQGATAICCASDKMAIGVAHAAMQRGLSIPEDLSIVGYDNDALCDSMFPELTTIGQDYIRIGKIAATLLSCMIQGLPVGPVSIHPELIVRSSTAAPKKLP